MNISELFSSEDLANHIENGFVKSQRHPDLPLTIYNYTPKTQYENAWDDVTRSCRGLIVDDEGTIIARPFPKFFNYGDTANIEEDITPDTPVIAYDKMDGSLGILYWYQSSTPRVATRGSFTSPMALHATELAKDLLISEIPGVTMMVEIVYPENQIVVDYKGLDDLVLLGGVINATGEFYDPVVIFNTIRSVYPEGGFRYIVQQFPTLSTVSLALENLNRENREGYVLHTEDGTMIKVKQGDYVQMHKLVFNTTKRVLWYSFARDAIAELDIPFNEVPNSHIKSFIDRIVEVDYVEDLTDRLQRLLPNQLWSAVESTLDGFFSSYEDQMDELVSIIDDLRDKDIQDRATLYREAEDKAPRLGGVIADIIMAPDEAHKNKAIDKMMMRVVESLMPAKHERLTDTLDEEDE